MTPPIDAHMQTRLNMTQTCLHTNTHDTLSLTHMLTWDLILILCIYQWWHYIPSRAGSVNEKLQPKVILRTLTHVLTLKGLCVSISSSVSHPHINSFASRNMLLLSRRSRSLKPPHRSPSALSLLWHRVVTPSPHHHRQRCEGMRQFVQEKHMHPSCLSRSNSWQLEALGRPCHVSQRGCVTMKIRDTATLCLANRNLVTKRIEMPSPVCHPWLPECLTIQ